MQIFQFTTSQGGRQHRSVCFLGIFILSIHDLTRRSTVTSFFVIIVMLPFNSRPHKEVDCPAATSEAVNNPFNSRPHKEVDVFFQILCSIPQSFNSRPHKEVDPPEYQLLGVENDLSIHDLTRRSTLYQYPSHPRYQSFNSRPHKEVDG